MQYTVKEFEELLTKTKTIMSKLKVSPIDVEKVAFVIIKENEPVFVAKPKPVPTGRPRGRPALPESDKKKPANPPVPGRKRGRPPGPSQEKAAPKTPNGTGKRGRPAKIKAEAEETETATKPKSKRNADDAPGTDRSKRAKV